MSPTQVQSWQPILAKIGYPTDCVVLDFESFFSADFGFQTHSTTEYVQSDKFEILGVAVVESATEKGVWHVDAWAAMEELQGRYGTDFAQCTGIAQNAKFDLLVLQRYMGIAPKFFIDTKDLAAHLHPMWSAKLGDLCKEYGLVAKGDTMAFKGMTRRRRWKRQGGRGKEKDRLVRLPIANAEQEQALAFYGVNDALREWDLFKLMLPRISRPSVEIPLAQHTTEQFLYPTLEIDVPRAERIRKDMIDEIEKAAASSGHSRSAISGNHSFRDLLTEALHAVGEDLPVKANKKGILIPAIAKTDTAYPDLLNHADPTVRRLMQARVALKAWPPKAKRVQSILKQAAANNGVLRVPLWYHGAHTGRWSGGEGINLQNLGSRGHPLDAEVRNTIVAPEGYSLVIVDQAAVEARGTAWVAGQHDLLEAFKQGVDVYCRFASSLFATPVRKARMDDPEPVRAWLKQARSCGKVGILGGGYGMGPLKCQSYGTGFGLTMSMGDAVNLTRDREILE
jgi:DNA polymerase